MSNQKKGAGVAAALSAVIALAPAMIPSGRNELNRVYGNPAGADGKLSQKWVAENLVYITPAYPLRVPQGGNKYSIVTKIQVHRKAAASFTGAFSDVWKFARATVKKRDGYSRSTAYYDKASLAWLQAQHVDLFAGTFNFRLIRGSRTAVSLHGYGVAIDIDPDGNPLGAKQGRMPRWFIEIWQKNGFFWGGNFRGRKDWMHFQRAKNV